MHPEHGPEQAPVIYLTEGREVIEKKLEEYRSRLDKFKAPELQTDTLYKIAVCEKLVKDGKVDTYALSRELRELYGRVDVVAFDNACGVIEDYIKTGGVNNRGGTGLSRATIEEPPKGRIM